MKGTERKHRAFDEDRHRKRATALMEKKPPPELDRDPYDTKRSVKLDHFEQYRGLLFSIAYRMLGSVSDAEDMMQETFIKWQEVTDENIRSPRSYLVTILSRLCINHLQSAQVQREEYIGVWLPEPIITDSVDGPFNLIKVDESISMAFLVLLERLTPTERAVFLLREVFEYEYGEIGSILRQSEVNCRQILKRARQHIAAVRPRFEIAKANHDALLESFLKAIGTGELSGLVALLAEDVVLRSDGGGKGVAVPNEIHGIDKVGRGILGGISRLLPRNLIRKLARINGEPGLINYLDGRPHSVLTIEVRGNRISSLHIITNPDKLKHLPILV
jgi:RNA polymerase sigma-70 factor (ECF subfamily)